MVEYWSPKPWVVGSSPSAPAKKKDDCESNRPFSWQGQKALRNLARASRARGEFAKQICAEIPRVSRLGSGSFCKVPLVIHTDLWYNETKKGGGKMENHYQEFDDLIICFNDARKYALDNAEYFENIKSSCVEYSTLSDFYYGIHTPSLILKIAYSKQYTKGRKLKNIVRREEYMSYEYDDSGRLIKISNHGENSTTFGCVFQLNGFEWVVPVYQYKNRYCEWYKAEMRKYDECGRISIYARFDTAQIWLERYTYPQSNPQSAICEFWNYVPNLSHSNKNKSVLETGSPAQLWIFELDLSDPEKITGELVESYERDTSAYRQKPPCLPPPQVSYKKNRTSTTQKKETL